MIKGVFLTEDEINVINNYLIKTIDESAREIEKSAYCSSNIQDKINHINKAVECLKDKFK